MKNALRLTVLLGLLSFFGAIVSAQVTTGTPPFGTFGGGPDTINLANLNVHLTIPVLQKAGRGIPFTYDITYDSSIWQPVGTSGSQTWEPTNAGAFGWSYSAMGNMVVLEGEVLGYCYTWLGPPINEYYVTGEEGAILYGYQDRLGTVHAFPGAVYSEGGTCGSSYSGNPGTTTDGSDYTGTVNSSGNFTVTDRNGNLVYWTNSNGTLGTPYATDTNGNQITMNSSNQFFDTLSSSTPVLAIAGAAPNPTTFTYTAPSGGSAAYTMKYTPYTVKTAFNCSGIQEYSGTQNLVTEIDLPDQGSVTSDKYTISYETTPGYAPGSGVVTGRITSVTLPTGGTINYSYSGGNNGIVCSDGSTATLTRQTPDGIWTYAHSENGTAWATNQTDPQGNLTVMNFQGIYATEAQFYKGTSSLLKTTYSCYNSATAPCNSTAISLPITQQTSLLQWADGQESESETNRTYSAGFVTEEDDYDFGSGSPGPLLRKVTTAYNDLNEPNSISVYNGSGTLIARTDYGYDETAVVSSGITTQHVSVSNPDARDNLTSVSTLVSGSTWLTKTFTYFDTGNVDVATDVNGAQTTYAYGACYGAFPTSVGEPLGLSKSMAWDCGSGVMTSVTDENGKTTTYGYTGGPYSEVLSSITDPLGNATNMTYGTSSVESSLVFNGGNSTTDHLTAFDQMGRPHIRQVKESPSSSNYDSVEIDYDHLGRPDKVTLPYQGTGFQACSGGCPGTSVTYDALGRPLTVTDGGGGTVTYQYFGNDTYESVGPAPSGENPKRKQLEYDAIGRLTSVCEITSASGSGSCSQTNAETGYLTTYTYDALGDLTGVTQGAQTRSYAYDGLGRMTSESNPESGTTTYSYDAPTGTCTNGYWNGWMPGTLVQKEDAAGNITCYVHDVFGRIGSVWVGAGPEQWGNSGCKSFYYDNSTGLLGSRPNGVSLADTMGRLVEAVTTNCVWPPTTSDIRTDEWFSYDARGETTDLWESTPHSGGYYHSTESYWANGTANQLYELNGSPEYSAAWDLDSEGRTASTYNMYMNPLTGTTYNPAGLPTQITFGSGDSDSYGYDPNTGRMTNYTFDVNGQSLTGNLTWNANGTLANLLITDPFNSANTQSCSYGHDDLARLASVNCGSEWSQNYTYDAFGNVTTSGNGQFQPGYNSGNQMQCATYDADGDATNDCENTYTWDAFGRPITVANSTGSVTVTYDAMGRAVEWGSGSYTQMVYSPSGLPMELMNAMSSKEAFVPLTVGSTAVYDNATGVDYIRHGDWLGSSRLASTAGRTIYYDGAYAPFGEAYAESGTTDRNFTGMDQDIVGGLYDFPAREYNALEGRWPSPDPAGLASVNPADPQTWNRYAYVRNSPLMMTDPLGLCPDNTVPYGAGCVPAQPIGTSVSVSDDDGCDLTCQLWFNIFYGSVNYLSAALLTPPTPYAGLDGGTGGPSGPQAPPSSKQACVNNFYASPVGKATEYLSPLSMIPGWGPNPLLSTAETAGFAAKYGAIQGGKAAAGASIISLSGESPIAGGWDWLLGKLATGADAAIDSSAVPVVLLATAVDGLAHSACDPSIPIPAPGPF